MESSSYNREYKVALLAPYSGSNLGDGAIQRAAIENFRNVDSNISLCGITLFPKDTERRHGIPCYPITGLVVKYYSSAENIFPSQEKSANKKFTETQKAVNSEKIVANSDGKPKPKVTAMLKRIPYLAAGVRFIRGRVYDVKNISGEIRAIARAYSYARNLDLIVVSGSGQINDEWGGSWGLPYSLCRWALIAKVTNTRFAIASVGSGSLRPLSKFFMGIALRSACYRSYRDAGTKLFVDLWPFTRSDPCVPDLVYSLDLPVNNSSVKNLKNKMRVGIAPISYGHPKRWPTENHSIYNTYTKELAAFIVWLVDNGHSIVFCTSSGADQAAVSDIKEILKTLKPNDSDKIIDSCDFPVIETTEELLENINGIDCIVASRLHSVILSHLLYKPTIAISFDRKVDAQMEMMNQLKYCFDIQNFNEENLIDSFTMLLDNFNDLEGEISAYVQKYKNEVLPQYKVLMATISNNSNSQIGG